MEHGLTSVVLTTGKAAGESPPSPATNTYLITRKTDVCPHSQIQTVFCQCTGCSSPFCSLSPLGCKTSPTLLVHLLTVVICPDSLCHWPCSLQWKTTWVRATRIHSTCTTLLCTRRTASRVQVIIFLLFSLA